ncbi:MAG: uridine diphosphate-N-acetylglucosamine-binding protein YvcK [Frankiaceae bacterium]
MHRRQAPQRRDGRGARGPAGLLRRRRAGRPSRPGARVTGPGRPPRVVALGGGHGLAASLRALRLVTPDVTAVVTVADDGGSSGRLRREFAHLLPPGDLRMALAALAGDDPPGGAADGGLWRRVFQHRFDGAGELAGHAVGNLVLAGLADVLGGTVPALDAAARLLETSGRVLPMALVPLDIVADVAGLDPDDPGAVAEVVGQVAVATTSGQVVGVRLRPEEPPACPDAVAAIESADWVVLGPGSWFTSVLPHLLVPGIASALIGTSARRAVVLNICAQQGETTNFSPETHLEVLAAFAPGLELDVVVANEGTTPDPSVLVDAARTLGAEVVLAGVATDDGSPRHDPARLAKVYDQILAGAAPPAGRGASSPINERMPDGTRRFRAGRARVDREGHPRWR